MLRRYASAVGIGLMFAWGLAILGIPTDLWISEHWLKKAVGAVFGVTASASFIAAFLYAGEIEATLKATESRLESLSESVAFHEKRADEAIRSLSRYLK